MPVDLEDFGHLIPISFVVISITNNVDYSIVINSYF